MNVLVVKKSTNLDIHGKNIEAAVKAGLLAQDEISSLEMEHEQHLKCLDDLRVELKAKKIKFDETGREEDLPNTDYDFYISVGGDGTLLSVGQYLESGGNIAGITSTDISIGHLCAIKRTQVAKFVEALASNRLPMQSISRMRAKVVRITGKTEISPPVINDILYTHGHPAGMSRYRLSLDGKFEEQRSSGIWISTAVGSTAAMKAAGGIPLNFDSRDFQFCVRERYDRKSGAQKEEQLNHAVFNPEKVNFMILNRSVQAILAMDGQRSVIELEFGDKITFERAKDVNLVRKL